MTFLKTTAALLTLLVLVPTTGCTSSIPRDAMGAYRFDDGTLISVRRSGGDSLRYRVFQDGTSGRLERRKGIWVSGPGFTETIPVSSTVRFEQDSAKRVEGLSWTSQGLPVREATRINRVEKVAFSSQGVVLSGRLHLPDGEGPFPAVAVVHGSGSYAATDYYYDGDFLAAHGIAALVFDKRGTGNSGGEYTFDFEALAEDVVAAVRFLSARDDVDAARIGLVGHSQGGWVAPMAASRIDTVGFVLVNFGLIESPAEEARLEMLQLVRERTNDPDAVARADELVVAAVRVVASGFREGWPEFDALAESCANEPWFDALSATPVGKLARYPRWVARLFGPRRAPKGLPWFYSSDALLETLEIPMLWVVGESDRSAPNEMTLPKLRAMINRGRQIELIVLPGADHTGLLFESANGTRTYTRYSAELFRTQVEWVTRMTKE